MEAEKSETAKKPIREDDPEKIFSVNLLQEAGISTGRH